MARAWRYPAAALALVLVDAGIAVGSLVVAYAVRSEDPLLTAPLRIPLPVHPLFAPYFALLPFASVVRVLFHARYHLYRLRGPFSMADDVIGALKAAALGSLVLVALAFMYRGGMAYRTFSYSRAVFLLDWVFCSAALVATRVLLRFAQRRARRGRRNLVPVVVVGRGDASRFLVEEIRRRPEMGCEVVALGVPDGLGDGTLAASLGIPQVPFGELPRLIERSGVEEVLVSGASVTKDALLALAMKCPSERQVRFRMVPDLMDFLPQKVAPGALGQLPLVELFADPLRGFWGSLKRAVDVAAAAGLLVFLSPLLGLIAFAVRWDSRGPALFRQRRMGRDGRPFTLYKFRTMAHGADESSHRDYLEKLIDGGDGGRGNEVERHQPLFKLNDDRRVTRVGRLLRPLSLDELPQLLNVLTGDMSLVGPRPAIEYEVERYRSWQRKRLDVSPGLTGLWQVSGRNRLSFEEMVRLDVYYIENWSPWMDLRILLQTPAAILRRETR